MNNFANVTEHNFSRRFICIKYPGVVENVDYMFTTLGGIRNISTAYSEKNRRLEVKFRPDDVHCKPACADKQKTNALLLKVVKKKNLTENEIEGDRYKAIVLGQIDTVFNFKNLCDFQYLPISYSDGKPSLIEVLPKGVCDFSWLQEDCPLFLPSAVFSRMDTVQGYVYRKDAKDDSTPSNYIGKTRRKKRGGTAVFASFEDEIPLQPRKGALDLLKLKNQSSEQLVILKKLFEERPVWSKNGVMYKTQFSVTQLKYLLPCAAFYFTNGPWRNMWVRFGYDPRTDPDSLKYQILDFRVRHSGMLKLKVKAKRSYTNYVIPYKSAPSSRPRTSLIGQQENEGEEKTEIIEENAYVFRAGMMPPSRQMFYQYCDLEIPEIQEMIMKLPEPLPQNKCHRILGWLPRGMADQCREIIAKIVSGDQGHLYSVKKKKIRRKYIPLPKHPSVVSRLIKRSVQSKKKN